MIIEKKLGNGIPVFFDKKEDSQSVTIGIFVDTGTKNEREKEHGISHFLEHMMFKGTKTRSSKELSEAVDDVGGNINAYTSKESTAYYIQLLPSRLEVGIDILGDMFLNSTFTEENIKKEKKVVVEEINMYEDIPEERIHEINASFAIKGSQSNPVLGTIESVTKITRDKLIDYFKRQYTPKNIVISLAGKMDVKRVIEKLNLTIGTIEEFKKTTNLDLDMKINKGDKIIKDSTNQIHLCINTMGISYLDENWYKYSIVSSILGENMSSRLFQKVREDRGLAYSIYSYISSFKEGGLFTVYAGTTIDSYEEVIKIVFEEFQEIKENGVTEVELERSKNQFLTSLTFGLENSKGRMSRMASSYLAFKEVKDIESIIKSIEKINCADIKEVAQKIFDKRYYSTTILGNIGG